MSEERELRDLLREQVLEMYGLLSEKPEVIREPRAPRREKPHPTFSTGSAPRPTGFASEGSAIPGRKAILVGTSIRRADKHRAGPGARLPGESDRDFIERKARIRVAQAQGLAPPTTDVAHGTDEYWEMGH